MDPAPSADRTWDSDAYDDGHSFVYEYGEDVLGLLDPRPGELVLDLGCGTGHLTAAIADADARAVGLDRSAEMLATARAEHPDRRFVRGDARALPVGGPFDAVFSNAVLHWIPGPDHDAVLAGVHDVLGPEGRFVAEFGGRGNVSAIETAVRAELDARGHEVPSPWYFPSVGEYAPRLESHGFEVTYATLFDRRTRLEDGEDGLAEWLGMFGEELFAPLSATERRDVVRAVEDRLRDRLFEDGAWHADYRRLRFVAEKREE